ncbi:MAG: serine protease [Alistipes sp.]|nr:serine protease [Alistipes sp.]
MSRVKNVSIRLAAFVIALVVAVVAFSAYGNPQDANAAYFKRYYWRHDYSDPALDSYTQYSLSVEESSRMVIGSNDMIRDKDTSVVCLSLTGNGLPRVGSGFIVGKHIIATAAHCVYNKNFERFYNIEISVVGSDNEELLTVRPVYAHISRDYVTSDDYDTNDFDYALLYVEEDLSQYGVFSFGIATQKYVENEGQVIVSGFPVGYKPTYEGASYGLRFKSSGNILPDLTDSYKLRYDADMLTGESGGPVYVEEGFSITSNGKTTNYEYRTVVAINVSEKGSQSEEQDYNAGIRIDANHLKFYCSNEYLTA